jgi:flagellar biosynthesis protein FlhG
MWRVQRARRPLLIERPDAPASKAFGSLVDGLLALDAATPRTTAPAPAPPPAGGEP